ASLLPQGTPARCAVETQLDPGRVHEVARRDSDRLQGAWFFVSGHREAQLLIAGEHFTMRFKSGDIYVGTFSVDPTHKPRAMDMVGHGGPERHRGKTFRAIYEFDGEPLIWCPGDADGQRLPAFPAEEDMAHLCIIFRRDRTRR